MGLGRDSRPWIPPRQRRAETVDFMPGFTRPVTPPPSERSGQPRPLPPRAAEPALDEGLGELSRGDRQRVDEVLRAHRGA
jgi:hypothetical protein